MLPFDDYPLWNYPRRVFAHYFPTFPLSIDNKPWQSDYYNAQFLTPTGEGGKWAAQGGFLRSRPMPVPVSADPNWKQLNMQREVQLAIERGITGWCYDVLNMTDGLFVKMLYATNAVDARFKVIPMLDNSGTVDDVVTFLAMVSTYPTIMRLADGRMLFSSFNATSKTLTYWTDIISGLNDKGINVAFMPTLLGGPNDAGVLNPISWGVGAWGTATPTPSAGLNPAKAHAAGLKFMSPTDPQQSRPKSSQFWEASNGLSFRNSWEASIATGCDLIQCITWNDFSEAAQVSPCTDATGNPSIGNGYYDQTAFYATWFATGTEPEIVRDVLYFTYRRANSKVAHPKQTNPFVVVGTPPEEDNVEIYAFLTDPGILQISIGGLAHSSAVLPAGRQVFKCPCAPGIPRFTLRRNGSNVFAVDGPAQIYGPTGLPSGILDMTYLNGSVSAAGINTQL